MVGVPHPLVPVWPPSVLSTWFDKSVYFLFGETVVQKQNTYRGKNTDREIVCVCFS